MALSDDPRSTPVLLILLAGLLGYMLYTGSVINSLGYGGLQGQTARVDSLRDSVTALQAATDSAKKELAAGTVEELRKRLDTYRASLSTLRRLVPDRNEVPNLLDDISTRAKMRGVNLSQVVPMPQQAGPTPFNTDQYQMQAIGHYDQIGAFLADIASLKRIIVPYDVSLAAAQPTTARALGDSTGALLEAKFQVRTYVKSATASDEEDPSSGT